MAVELKDVTGKPSGDLEQDDGHVGWLRITRFLWANLALSTLIMVFVYAQFEQEPFSRSTRIVGPMVVLGIVFGFLSYLVSQRIKRGPQRKLSRPGLSYLGNSLLAMVLSWFLAVFGGVCVIDDLPFWAALLVFFVPAWLLFLVSMPTRAKLTAWTAPKSP